MNGTSFDPSAPSIRVPVWLVAGRTAVKYLFVLDTGATRTAIHPKTARVLKLEADPTRVAAVPTASGTSTADFFLVPRILSLGVERSNFPVLAQEFPRSFTADGLLGLDFFRGRILTIDFSRSKIRLRAPRPWWQFWK